MRTDTITFAPIAACACVVAWLMPTHLDAQGAPNPPPTQSELARPGDAFGLGAGYLALVNQYAAGERADAIAALGSWSETALRHELAVANAASQLLSLCASLAFRDQNPKKCLRARIAFEQLPLRAAALLHADRDAFERGIRAVGASPSCWSEFHADLANLFAELLGIQPDGQAFDRRFYLSLALEAHSNACFLAAQRWAQAGVKLAPKDGLLNLALGTSAEAIAFLTVPPKRKLWEEALSGFEEALDADPSLEEARLHLGRVLWRLERKGPALAAFEKVLTGSKEPRLLYLAHLFLGRIHEEAARIDRAEEEYRAALAIDPTAQAAAVALSYTLQLAGRPDASREVLRKALGHAPRYGDGKPQWGYLASRSNRG